MPKRRDEQAPYWQQLRVAERGIIEYALEHGITIRGTAAILGISPNYLGERLHLLGIPVPDVRPGPKPGTPRRPAPPKLQVVEAPGETLDEDEDEDEDADEDEDKDGEGDDDDESDVLEEETEEGDSEDENDVEGEGDPWDGEDEDENDGNDQGEDANAQGN